MQCTKIFGQMKRDLDEVRQKTVGLNLLVQKIHACGGRIVLVGGAVRDLFLGIGVKDIDLEVYGIESDKLLHVLAEVGNVDYVGKSFGVFKFFDAHLRNIDISLPRLDTAGRKPEVIVNPNMSVEATFRRRDLTINAIGIDLMTDELLDPFGGCHDLRIKKLRAVDPVFFVQDPLRFYRVMQFISRFEMDPDEQLNSICMAMDVSSVSIERIETEFEKLFLKSVYPSRGIRWIAHIKRLSDLFPELAATVGVIQSPIWHPEGDVFEHSMQTLDAAAVLEYENDFNKMMVMYAALCHDFGKATTTKIVDGRITSRGHEIDSARFAKKLLSRITEKKDLVEGVLKLVEHHMQPLQFVADHAKLSAYKRLAHKLAPQATLALIAQLACADRRGRNPLKMVPLTSDIVEVEQFLENAQAASVLHHVEEPILLGRDVMDIVEPGPRMGDLLRQAYEIQIEEDIHNKEELKRRITEKN